MPALVHSSRDVIVRTPAHAAARHFYGDVLGLPVQDDSATLLRVEAGAFRLFVEVGEAHGPVFDFLVRDVPAAKARLVEAGCVVLEEDAAVPRCYLRDPFGLVFNLGLSATPD